MKLKNLYIAIMLVSVGMLSSCSDWLTTEPNTGVIVRDFWQSKEDVNSAVIACYSSMQSSVVTSAFLWGELRGDLLTYMSNCPERYRLILEGEIKPDNSVVDWGAFYSTINYCNTVIEFAPQVLDIDESFTQKQLDAYLSEAYGLRALMYLYLVRSFGEVPLVLEASTSDDQDFSVAKSDMDVILTQIISDLLTAKEGAVVKYEDNASTKGRITLHAINAMLADAYLWKEDPANALIVCDEIINSGQYGLLEGNNNWFYNMYGVGNSAESIFELQYDVNKTNPFYGIMHQTSGRQLGASEYVYEDLFLVGENTNSDSIDIRGDNASYKSSRNNIVWKYMGWDNYTGRESYESYANYIFYRYSEILLFKAEALTLLDRGTEALPLIYTIRKRAMADAISDEDPSGDEREAVLNFIVNERAREFAFEGKRWYDVLRVARHDDYAYLDILITMVKYAALPEKQQSVVAKHRDYNYHYFPISQDELNVNPNLVQNEYYVTGN